MTQINLQTLSPLMYEIEAWANQNYPEEACGVVVEKDGLLEVMCRDNLQNELHARDPGSYPRDARTAYNLDPIVLCQVEASGGSVRVVFHSHPDRGAYFSDEDVLCALGGDPDGTPVLPGVDYLVLSSRANGVDDAKLFVWDDSNRKFEEQ